MFIISSITHIYETQIDYFWHELTANYVGEIKCKKWRYYKNIWVFEITWYYRDIKVHDIEVLGIKVWNSTHSIHRWL